MLQLISIICFIALFIIRMTLRNRKKIIHPEYLDARAKALNARPDKEGLPTNKVFGVVIELDLDGGRMTNVVFRNGKIASYNSHDAPDPRSLGEEPDYVQSSARNFVELAQNYLHMATLNSNTDFPAKKEIQFYFLTPSGRATYSAPLLKVAEKGHPFYPLFMALSALNEDIAYAEKSRKYASGSQYVVTEE